jgi:uncharacterized phiE125 gp8 family phage protein
MERLEPKAPSEVRNYAFDWSTFLGTDTITGTPVVTVTGATKVSQSNDTTSVTVKVSGGTGGTVARIVNTITTAGGLTETETFILPITDADEPVSLAEAKAQLRIVDDTSEDALISSYISSARAYVESESGFVFVRRQFVDSFNYWPRYLSIGRRPLISIDAINYTDSAGASQTLNGANYYTALLLRRVTPVGSWPTIGNGGSIMVTYTAGFDEGEQAEEVDLARQAILMLVTTWFENRSSVSTNNIQASEIPFAVRALIDRFRTQVV